MIQLTSLEHDLKPYGFVKLDYGRTWTNGNIAFIGLNLVIVKQTTSKDFEAVAKLYTAEIINIK